VAKKLSDFANAANPVRVSSLPNLIKCPFRAVMMYLDDPEDTSGQAADTGSAVHKAAQLWHAHGMTVEGAIKGMADSLPDYPQADLSDAESQFLAYALDPRNTRAKIVACEKEVVFSLPPSEKDPTQTPVFVRGHLDQIREDEDGVLKLYDIKTSKRPGITIRNEHAYQIAAYCIGATELLKRPVHPGAVIMTRGYLKRGVDPREQPSGVFFNYPWNLDRCKVLVSGVADVVAMIRSGTVWASPGDYCNWCPMKAPDFCIERLYELAVL
jgi:hypothetical protein